MNKTYFELAELKSPTVSYACPRQSRTHYILVLHWYLWCTYQCTQHIHQSRRPSIHRNGALSTFTQSFQGRGRYHEQRSDVSPRSGWPKTTSSSMLMVRPGQWLHNVKQAEFKHNPTRWSMYVTLSPVSNKITNHLFQKTPSKTSWPVEFANPRPGQCRPAALRPQLCTRRKSRGFTGFSARESHLAAASPGQRKRTQKTKETIGSPWFSVVYHCLSSKFRVVRLVFRPFIEKP